jgi:ectoine hydroxylase
VLNPDQQSFYRDKGYLVLENCVPMKHIEAIRKELAHYNEIAASMETSDDRIDLETTHTRAAPRIRRIKLPHRHLESCRELMYQDCVLSPVRDLIGPDLRLHTSKLNLKSAGFGAAVEWHQDWAFYPHTNDDILAVGVMIDDMSEDNGALLVIPGSHNGPIHDHHSRSGFSGAIAACEVDSRDSVSLTAPAGSISLHHVRLIHGSDLNRSEKDRRLLLYEITAADAFPIMGGLSKLTSIEEYDSRLLCGEPTLRPRLRPVPVRIPQPAPTDIGSIYELQQKANDPAFESIIQDG